MIDALNRIEVQLKRIADSMEKYDEEQVVHTLVTAPTTVAEVVAAQIKLTEADVRKAIATHVNKHGVDGTRAILKKFGDGMVASIPTEKYADVIKALGE